MSRGYQGDFPTGATVYFYFDSYDGATGASEAISGLAVGDIKIYKNGSTTERSSTSGFTLLDTDGIDFDLLVGINGFSIDTSDNTDAGFYAAGNEYAVVVASVTADAQTVNFVQGSFSIERSGGALALIKNATYGLAALKTDVSGVQSDTNDIQTRLPAALVSGRMDSDIAAALDEAGTELTAIPSTTGTLRQQIKFLFQYFRNKRTVTATTETLFKEDATTSLGTATVSDDGTIFTKGETA